MDDSTESVVKKPHFKISIRQLSIGTALFLVFLIGGFSFLFTYIDVLRPQIERWASNIAERPLKIEKIDGLWNDWDIIIELHNVQFLNPVNHKTTFAARNLELRISPLQSLLKRSLYPGNLTIKGAEVALIRKLDGSLVANRIRAPSSIGTTNRYSTAGLVNFGRWLFTQSSVAIHSSTVDWIDLRHPQQKLTLDNVSLSISSVQEGISVEGTADIATEQATNVIFSMMIDNGSTFEKSNGKLDLKVQELQLSSLRELTNRSRKSFIDGKLDVKLSSEWTTAVGTRCHGHFRLENIILNSKLAQETLPLIDGNFLATKNGKKLDGRLSKVSVHFGSKHPAIKNIAVRATIDDIHAIDGNIVVEAPQLQLEQFVNVAKLVISKEHKDNIDLLAPSGVLEKVQLDLDLANDVIVDGRIKSTVNNLSLNSMVEDLSIQLQEAEVDADLHSGELNFPGTTAIILTSQLFPEPLKFSDVTGTFSWRREGKHWWLFSTDLTTHNPQATELTVVGTANWFDQRPSPFVDIGIRAKRLEMPFLVSHLPTHLLSQTFSTWLQNTHLTGALTDTELRLKGYTLNLNSGGITRRIRGRSSFEGIGLTFAEDWPPLEKAAGKIFITDTQAGVIVSKAEFYGVQIQSSNASISKPGRDFPFLEIHADFQGPSARALEFLTTGPLKDSFAKFSSKIDLEGNASLRLDLSFELPNNSKFMTGDLYLSGVNASLLHANTSLEKLTGTISFTNDTVKAESLRALYLGTPVEISINSGSTKSQNLNVLINGRADREFLMHLAEEINLLKNAEKESFILSQFNGETSWSADINFPLEDDSPKQTVITLTSDLKGLVVSLPAPFHKPLGKQHPLSLEIFIPRDDKTIINLDYGPRVSAKLEFQTGTSGVRFNRGTLAFGEPPILPIARGLNISGELQRISFEEWTEILQNKNKQKSDNNPILGIINKVDLKSRKVELLGYRFLDSDINVTKKDGSKITLSVQGPNIDGVIKFPGENENQPIEIILNRLDLIKEPNRQAGESPIKLNPNEIPPLIVSCDQFMANGKNLGTIEFVTERTTGGLKLSGLNLQGNGYGVTGKSLWIFQSGTHETTLEISIKASELQFMLNALGFDEKTVLGGESIVQLHLTWPGRPSEFGLGAAQGQVTFQSTNGRLLELSPGATSRMFGFLLMTSLPRRLRLDFSDIFDEGVEYETIDGVFDLDHGNAYTNNLTLENPSAMITVAGRTGILHQDYDQVVTVTPKLSSSLPLVPIWLLQKILNKQIFDKAFRYEYYVTGKWENPNVERQMIESENPDQ